MSTSNSRRINYPGITPEAERRKTERELLTPFSYFPSRALPPLGTRGIDLDKHINCPIFKPGENVLVRKLGPTGWTPWIHGIVIEKITMHGYAGAHATGYNVKVTSPDGKSVITRVYVCFAEIWTVDLAHCPELDPKLTLQRIRESTTVYANLPVYNRDARTVVWSPASIYRWGEDEIRVMSREHDTSGRVYGVQEYLAYQPDVANACKNNGHVVQDKCTCKKCLLK